MATDPTPTVKNSSQLTNSKIPFKSKGPKKPQITLLELKDLPFNELLPYEETRDLEKVDAIVADIEPRFTPQFRKFCLKFPDSNQKLHHLKRFCKIDKDGASKLSSIICLAEDYSLILIQSKIAEFELADHIKPYIHKVPKFTPLNRAQFDSWKGEWPMGFHENIDKVFRITKDENDFICETMEKVLETSSITLSKSECSAYAVIADPAQQKVLAQSFDLVDLSRHPLNHSIMLCIQSISSQHLSLQLNDSASSMKRKMSPNPEQSDENTNLSKTPYLCTGLDVYLSHEPCVMCCMAMVHSRVRRVYYRYTNEKSGGLSSKYNIHCHKGLNHHFRVFRGEFRKVEL